MRVVVPSRHAGNTTNGKALWVFLPGSLEYGSENPLKLSELLWCIYHDQSQNTPGGLIIELSEPLCKLTVNPFSQQNKMCFTGNAVANYIV